MIETSPSNYSIIALTETWLKPCIADAQVILEKYNVFRADRLHRGRGGALLYIKKDIAITISTSYDDDICQAVFCISPSLKLMIFSAYKPCDASPESFSNMLNFITNCINKCEHPDSYTILVLGDFNFPDLWRTSSEVICAKSTSEIAMQNFTDTHFLCQYVDVSTREGNILDLCFTNNDRLVYSVKSEETILSDHDAVDILLSPGELVYSKPSSQTPPKLSGFQSLNLFKADFTSICSELSSVDWQASFDNSALEDFPKALFETVLTICREYTPLKQLSPNGKKSKDRSMKAMLRKLQKLKCRLKCIESRNPSSPRSEVIRKEILDLKNKVKSHCYATLDKAERKAIAKMKSKPKYFYKYAKKRSKVMQSITQLYDKVGTLHTDRKSLTNILQAQFVSSFSNPSNPEKKIPSLLDSVQDSLSDINLSLEDIIRAIDEIDINASCPVYSIPAPVLKNCKQELAVPLLIMWKNSISVGEVPLFYKKQLITPAYKKGSRAFPVNYRPISLTAHEIKIFERIIRDRLVNYLDKNNFLSHLQHGFRKGKSCLTQLLKHYDNILSNLLANEETDSIFLDFAKAFDKVDYEILLQKIKNLGITGKLFNWISDFLTNRQQVVVLDGVMSFVAAVISGVPQGTVLGPILFLIFINDITDSVNHSTLSCFADDTRVSKSIASVNDSLLLQEDMDSLLLWAKSNNMEMHEDKFVYMNFNCRSRNFYLPLLPFYNENLKYSIPNTTLEPSNEVKDLGITFTSNLSWSSHVFNITSAAKKKAGWVLSCFRDRSPSTMLTLYKSVVRSHLEYGCPLWNGLSLTNLRDIEAIQRSFTTKISCPAHVNTYWDRLEYLNLMSLQRRRERYVIISMWKIFHEKMSNDLQVIFKENSRRGPIASIPPLVSPLSKAQTLFDNSFPVKGAQLWNLVPQNTKLIVTIEHFKIELDKWLLLFPDRPPVHGYSVQNNNSVLEWASSGSY